MDAVEMIANVLIRCGFSEMSEEEQFLFLQDLGKVVDDFVKSSEVKQNEL